MATKFVMGLFKREDQAVAAIRDLKQSEWPLLRTHSPIPSHKIFEAVGLKSSKVGWFTLCGGMVGFITGFALAIFTAQRWELIASGKPALRQRCSSASRHAAPPIRMACSRDGKASSPRSSRIESSIAGTSEMRLTSPLSRRAPMVSAAKRGCNSSAIRLCRQRKIAANAPT